MRAKQDTKKANGGEAKATMIDLYPDDLTCIESIKQAHGLLRVSDCIRLALRETQRQIELTKQQQQTA